MTSPIGQVQGKCRSFPKRFARNRPCLDSSNQGHASQARLTAACEDATGAVWLRTADGQLRRYHDGLLSPPWPVGSGRLLGLENHGLLWLDTGLGVLGIDPVSARDSMPLPYSQFSAMTRVDSLLPGREGGDDQAEKWTADTPPPARPRRARNLFFQGQTVPTG